MPPSTLLYPLWAPGGWPGSKALWGSHTKGKKEDAHSAGGIFLEPGSDSFLLTPVPSVFCPVGYWTEGIPASLTLGSCPVPCGCLRPTHTSTNCLFIKLRRKQTKTKPLSIEEIHLLATRASLSDLQETGKAEKESLEAEVNLGKPQLAFSRSLYSNN